MSAARMAFTPTFQFGAPRMILRGRTMGIFSSPFSSFTFLISSFYFAGATEKVFREYFWLYGGWPTRLVNPAEEFECVP